MGEDRDVQDFLGQLPLVREQVARLRLWYPSPVRGTIAGSVAPALGNARTYKVAQTPYTLATAQQNSPEQTNKDKSRVAMGLRSFMVSSYPGSILALASLLLTLIWISAVRPLDAPDEPAHLQAIMQVRKQHVLPEVHFSFTNPQGEVVGSPGDRAVADYTAGYGFSNRFVYLPYESSQAPLYYVVTGVLALAAPAEPQIILYLGRIVAALFGAGTVYFCWAATRQLAPDAPLWAVVVGSTVALLPQFCFNSATASNDSAVNLFSAASFYVWFRSLRDRNYDPWLLRSGVLVGLAILSKLTGLLLVPGLVLLFIFRVLRDRGQGPVEMPEGRLASSAIDGTATRQSEHTPRSLKMALGGSISALAICGWWIGRNFFVYGEPTGSQNAFQLYRLTDAQLNLLDTNLVLKSLVSLWESTWGRYGWMDRLLPVWLYLLVVPVVLSLLAATIYAVWRFTHSRHASGLPRVPQHVKESIWVMLAVSLAVLLGYLQFNVTVALQAQARYLFPLLLPASLLLTAGIYLLTKNGKIRVIALALPILGLALLNAAGIVLVLGQTRHR
ncbi:MAG: glycosyltransferase family 39 protein [Chloroflexota bacterium]|nr:glycosyltransferase family 39 protein [Chloroflexota bacterium]